MKGNMTEGNISKILICFSIPMIFGNIFQQLYNTTDAIIVGRYVGKNALAAVGVANPIMSIAIFFIFGICIGTSVLMAQFFGAEKYKVLKREISTSLIAGIIFTVVISILCIAVSKNILALMDTPVNIINDADLYLKIIFAGLIFSFLYNFYSSALTAIGDSKTPLIFLLISCVLNGVLCIVLIGIFKLGVAGSAIATVIAQGVSSILCIIYVYIKVPVLSIRKNDIAVDKKLLIKTIQYSWVSAVQQACLYIGRLLVQGVVNPFGTDTIAAYNSVTRVDAFMLSPGDALGVSIATYAAQNKGAEKPIRIIEGFKKSNLIIMVYGIVISVIIFAGTIPIMKLFVSGSEANVISIGVEYLRNMSVFYVVAGFTDVFQGLFRGIGKLRVTFIATVLYVAVRTVLSYAFTPVMGIKGLCYAVVAGWISIIVYEGIACRKYFRDIRTNINQK